MRRKITAPPSKQIFVKEKKQEFDLNLEGWVKYLENISKRIKIIKPDDKKFDLKKWKEIVEESKLEQEENTLVGWPDFDDVAFALFINSSNLSEPKWLVEHAYFFCFNDYAFGFSYFDIDSYFENESNDSLVYLNSYSLESYPRSALTWEYI